MPRRPKPRIYSHAGKHHKRPKSWHRRSEGRRFKRIDRILRRLLDEKGDAA